MGGTPSSAAPVSGTFVDSPVDGLHYTSPPSNPAGGVTSNGGRYQCQPGDVVTFDIAGRVIGNPQPCGSSVTAFTVFGATSTADPRVVGLAQVLLTLGGIPGGENPIQLPPTIPVGLPNPLNFSDPNFTTVLQTALPGTTVVTQGQATTHLQTSFKTLSVTVVYSGTVTSAPAGINCTAGTCSFAFIKGTNVTLTPTGTGFTGWSGAGCNGTGACVVTVNVNKAVTATFSAAPPPATLTMLPNQGTGTGSVTCSTSGGAFGACAASYPNGTELTLQGVADNGSTFVGWIDGTGNATGCNSTTVNCSMTLTADSAVRANFALNVTYYSVTATTASANGGGGTVQCSTNGGAAGDCGSYPVGTLISVIATPNSASLFTGWTNGTGSVTANCSNATGPCTVPLTADTSLTANFNRPTLWVVLAGTGTVTSTNIAGINCGTACIAAFDRGTSITLAATGTGIPGWSGGGCSGTSTCQITLDNFTTVTATFTPPAPLSFTAQVPFGAGSGPSVVALGDVNGDGKNDLAVTNFTGGTVSVLLNTTAPGATTPSFTDQVPFVTGGGANYVALGDVNGDGKLDLAVANWDSSNVSVLLNQTVPGAATPSFAPQVPFATGSYGAHLAFGDVNGDGKLDMVVGSHFSGTVSVLLNQTVSGATTPSFAPQVLFVAQGHVGFIALGDLNGDGKLDMAVTNNLGSSTTISVLLNQTAPGAATPSFAPQVAFTAGLKPYGIAMGDMNGDDKLDLAVTNMLDGTISTLLNTTAPGATTPSFATQVSFAAGVVPYGIAIGDMNGDSTVDLAATNLENDTVSVLLNTTASGASTPSFTTQVPLVTGDRPASVALGDLNGDGTLDLAVANHLSNTASVLLNQ